VVLWDPDGNFYDRKRHDAPPILTIAAVMRRVGLLNDRRPTLRYRGRPGAPQEPGDIFCAAWVTALLQSEALRRANPVRSAAANTVKRPRRIADAAALFRRMRRLVLRNARLRSAFVSFLVSDDPGTGMRTEDVLKVIKDTRHLHRFHRALLDRQAYARWIATVS
jgi:hypothetical protein